MPKNKPEKVSESNSEKKIEKARENLRFLLKDYEKKDLYKRIVKLPKTDLHCHLDGSLRLETVIDLIREEGIPYPIDAEYLQSILVKDNMIFAKDKSLEEYLKAFSITCSVLQTKCSLERVAFELAEDAAKENVRYLEVRFAPILHTNKGMKLKEVTNAVIDGLTLAEKKFNITCGVIICALRHYVPCAIQDNLLRSMPHASPEEASVVMAIQSSKHTAYMARNNPKIVGFDLAGGEYGNPATRYMKAFASPREHCIPITIHAGEGFGPKSIRQAILSGHADRIGHGTNLYQDPLLTSYFVNERIPLEVCITSNLQTNSEIHTYDSHPLKYYLQNRLRTTINTDNRLVSNTTVSKELYIISKVFNLDFDEIKLLIMHGFNSTFYNCHFPSSKNSYNYLRGMRTEVEGELQSEKVQDRVRKRWMKELHKRDEKERVRAMQVVHDREKEVEHHPEEQIPDEVAELSDRHKSSTINYRDENGEKQTRTGMPDGF
ncbi:adenosine deaminase [Candidatus Riflebacteria bacterium]